MANSLASQIISYAVNNCKIDGNSSGITALADADMLSVLNRANNEFIESPYQSGGVSWDFMEAETGYTLISDTGLSADVASGASSLSVTTSSGWAASSGAAVIFTSGNPDTFEYTAVSAGSATGVSGIGFAHSSGDAVSYLYPLPSNFGKFRQQEAYGDGVRVSGNNYFFCSGPPVGYRFSLYDNGTSKWIWFPRNCSGYVSVIYDRAATTISSTTTTVDVPAKYEAFLILRLEEHVKRVLMFNQQDIEDTRRRANIVIMDAMKQRRIGKRPRLIRRNPSSTISIDGKTLFYAI